MCVHVHMRVFTGTLLYRHYDRYHVQSLSPIVDQYYHHCYYHRWY